MKSDYRDGTFPDGNFRLGVEDDEVVRRIKINPGPLYPIPSPEVKAVPVSLTPDERQAAVKVLSKPQAISGKGDKTGQLIDKIVEAINTVRMSDPVGTLRKSFSLGGKYAFAYAPAKYLLIDTNAESPAYKTATEDEAAVIREEWTVVSGPQDGR